MLWITISFCQTVFNLCLWLTASSRREPAATGMMSKYSIPQLLSLNNYTTPTCISAIKPLGILRRPHYIHRGSRRKFVYNQPCPPVSSIPSIWTTVAHLPRHHSADALGVNSTGHTELCGKRGVDSSLLLTLQKPSISSTVKIELFNAQSLTNKSAFIQDHIMDKGIDFMCLTETWQQPEVYCALNEACPPGYSYLEKSRSTGRGGGLAIIHRNELELSPLPLPVLSSFECLGFKCKPPLPLTILLIYRPPKPNSAFIPEMHDLLSTLCATSANIIILGDLNIHVDTPSCHYAAEFLHLLDCLNLTQHVDVPTHTRGHTLDLVITNSDPISKLSVYDLGVSDHKAISMELPLLLPHTKPKRQIRFRNLKNINPDTMTSDLQHLSTITPTSVN